MPDETKPEVAAVRAAAAATETKSPETTTAPPAEPQGFPLDSIENLARAVLQLRGALNMMDAYLAGSDERLRRIELRLGMKPWKPGGIIH